MNAPTDSGTAFDLLGIVIFIALAILAIRP